MPHVEMPDNSFLKKETLTMEEFFSPRKIKEALKQRHEDRILGSGAECVVVSIHGDEKKVAAYRYSEEVNIFEAKRTFYLHRIFSMLFPHNFPRFYGSFASRRNQAGELELPGGTIRQKIEGKTRSDVVETPVRAIVSLIIDKIKIKYPFKDVEKKCLEMGFIDPIADTHGGNFIRGVDGGEYYVDTIPYIPFAFNIDRVTEYMATHGYTKTEIQVVRTSFERLRFLVEEEKKKALRAQ